MRYSEIPSDNEVVAALRTLNGQVTAVELCDLLARTHPRRDCQLAIQRAIERGKIRVGKNWILSVDAALAA